MKEIILASLPAAIPTLTVLVALLINQVAINRLASEVRDVRGEIGGLRGEFRSEIGGLRGEINSLRKQLHDDIVMLVSRDTEKAERLARLEEKTSKL
jgi:hypothetical protein